MTLETKLVAITQAIGADVKALKAADGDLTSLSTTAKTSLVAAINELKTLVGTGGGGGVGINDAAGTGVTTETWSADKIFNTIEAAKLAVTNSLVNGAGAALDTLNELAAALGNDPSFAATIATQIAVRVRYDAPQTLTALEQAQVLTNIGAMASVDIGNPDNDLVAIYTAAKV